MTDFPERSLQVLHLDEPKLEFGYGQTSDSPKDGLFLYGPNKAPSRPNISVGVVGTGAHLMPPDVRKLATGRRQP